MVESTVFISHWLNQVYILAQGFNKLLKLLTGIKPDNSPAIISFNGSMADFKFTAFHTWMI